MFKKFLNLFWPLILKVWHWIFWGPDKNRMRRTVLTVLLLASLVANFLLGGYVYHIWHVPHLANGPYPAGVK